MNPKRKIVISVCAIHILLLLYNMVNTEDSKPIPITTISVNTYTLPKPVKNPVKTQKKVQKTKQKPKKAKDMMQDLQKSIAKIPPKRDIQDRKPQQKPQYPLLLVQALKQTLHLPEEGDVKLTLTLRADGTFLSMDIADAKSAENAAFLKTHLPTLHFPAFTPDLGLTKEHTFTLTVRHDD